MSFRVEFYQTSKEELMRILLKVFNNINTEQTLTGLFCEPTVAQVASQKKTKQKKRITEQFSLNPQMQKYLIKQNK